MVEFKQTYYSGGDNTINLSDLPQADNSLMWYTALLPFFGVIFELYAASKYLGILLWAVIIVMRILVCRKDCKMLIKMGMWQTGGITPAVYFPVVYMFQRSKALRRTPTVGIVAVVCVFFALVSNGFATALTNSDEDYIDMVKDHYTSYILDLPNDKNYVADPTRTVDALLNIYCTTGNGTLPPPVEYEYKKTDGKRYVTAKMTKGSESISVTFLLDYDGYYYNGMYVEDAEVNGKEMSEKEIDEFLKEAFMIDVDSLQKDQGKSA